jgi:hypothetical protein
MARASAVVQSLRQEPRSQLGLVPLHEHKYIDLTDTTPFGSKEFKIPFDATGKKWVRFSVWDSAGNGAWVQPTDLK